MAGYITRRVVRPSSGPGTFADETVERRVVDNYSLSGNPQRDAPDQPRPSMFEGVGRSPNAKTAHYDVVYYKHADAPWASDVEGRPSMTALVKAAIAAYQPARQDARGAAGSQNPYVDRINLRNPDAASYGSLVDQATGGEYVYMAGV